MKGNRVGMIVKIDLEKTFDRLEWSYIKENLDFFKFSSAMTNLIMSCVSSNSTEILVNGRKTKPFFPSRRIRHPLCHPIYLSSTWKDFPEVLMMRLL